MQKIPVGISNRHVHLSQTDLETLFGQGKVLTKYKDLAQPGQYAAEEKIEITGPKGSIAGVRVLGPVRRQTQVEVSRTDAFSLGIDPPLRDSGNLAGSAPIILSGPAGKVHLTEGAILAQRHVHVPAELADKLGLGDGQLISLHCSGPRSVIFNEVLIRVSDKFRLEFHVDVDEANGALLSNGDTVILG